MADKNVGGASSGKRVIPARVKAASLSASGSHHTAASAAVRDFTVPERLLKLLSDKCSLLREMLAKANVIDNLLSNSREDAAVEADKITDEQSELIKKLKETDLAVSHISAKLTDDEKETFKRIVAAFEENASVAGLPKWGILILDKLNETKIVMSELRAVYGKNKAKAEEILPEAKEKHRIIKERRQMMDKFAADTEDNSTGRLLNQKK
ncbi:hypothetical protein FACS1894219_05590 [Clostridia bacterium]|nr:hypothetical protein FACS1894219_05590 [Clostridia bacterium]